MKVFLHPKFDLSVPDKGQGGIKRVVEAQVKYLPDLGVEFVSDLKEADVVNCHATDIIEHPNLVLSTHGLYWEDDITKDRLEWDLWAHRANAKLIEGMKLAKAVTCPSHWVANAIRRGMLIDPLVVHHGVDPDFWTPGKAEGYVGWFKTRPDPVCDPLPVKTLSMLCPEVPFVTTFGDTSKNTLVTGKLPFDKVKPLIQNASVYLATVRETFGVTVLEAMASGVPPLGFNWGANPEIITHKENGYLVPPGDYEALKEGLYYCLEHQKRLGSAARETVLARFTWEKAVLGYLEAYQAALKKHTGPKVSVIITAYNLEQYLPAAVESILKQDFADWELIIVDDASPDRCGEMADDYAATDHRVKVIHNPTNQYLAEARNIGIRNSRGQYIIPLDADDRLASDALGILSRALDLDRTVDIVTGSMQYNEGEEWLISGWPIKEPSYDYQIQKKNMVPYASMYRRWVWERTGGYRRRMKTTEDAEFWTRAMSYGAVPAKVTDRVTLIYLNRPESMSHTHQEPNWTAWFPWAKIPHLTPFGASGTPPNRVSRPVYSYDPPLLSVVIPVGPGHETYMQDALDSLLAQTFRRWEVILVNDTGKTWLSGDKIISPYLMGFPFVHVVETEGSTSPARARNRGIQASKTPLFVLLDADDYAQPYFLEAVYKAYQQAGGWVYSDWLDQDGTIKQAEDWDPDRFLEKMLGPSTGLYEKAAWELVGGFDEEAPGWEDWIFQLALFENGLCGSHLSYPGFTYRYHTGQQREKNFADKESVLVYIKEKFTELLQRKELFMGCRTCGGGGGRKKLEVVQAESRTTQSAIADNMVLVQYVGPQEQFQRLRSKSFRNVTYRFGGRLGDETRFFYAYPQDAEWILANVHFMPVTTRKEKLTDLVGEVVPVLEAQDHPKPIEAQPVPISQLAVLPETLSILQNNGYYTIESLQRASDAELLSIKGIGTARLRGIRKAVSVG